MQHLPTFWKRAWQPVMLTNMHISAEIGCLGLTFKIAFLEIRSTRQKYLPSILTCEPINCSRSMLLWLKLLIRSVLLLYDSMIYYTILISARFRSNCVETHPAIDKFPTVVLIKTTRINIRYISKFQLSNWNFKCFESQNFFLHYAPAGAQKLHWYVIFICLLNWVQ